MLSTRYTYQILMKISMLGTELFRVDGQTDGHDEVNSYFSQLYELV
jgi:hypothetical protein